MSNVDTAEVPVVGMPLLGPTVRKPLGVFGLLGCDRVRPRIAETEPGREFLGSKFGGRFNDCPQRVAMNPRVFAVGVVDAPKLIPRLLRHRLRRIHAASEHDAASRQVRIAHFLYGASFDKICCTGMNAQLSLVKLALCGPGDVMKEIQIAQEVVTEWNLQHGEARGCWIKHQHWSTDSHPDLSDRAQGVINRQVIDDSDLIVAIFWSRFGTPTGVADSGTEEEIRKGIKLRRTVMVYFSDLEPIPSTADRQQLERLWSFRRELQSTGLCWRFSSRDQFRREFARHLAFKLNEFKNAAAATHNAAPAQTITGDNNVQAGRDINVFTKPATVKKVIARKEGGVSPDELCQIKMWIEELAEGEVGISRKAAFGKWGAILLNTFGLDKREELLSAQMGDVRAWFIQQRAMQTRGQKTKAPDEWRRKRIGAVKAAMNQMGVTNEAYYPELARRLRMRKPFTSLKDLTKRDLDRVYSLVMRDAREG